MRNLHQRLIDGDRAAVSEVAECFLGPLQRRLARRFPRAPLDHLTDATEDAILDYASHPARFNPAVGVPLERYLYVAAWRNVANMLRADTRRRLREARYAEEVGRRRHCAPAEPESGDFRIEAHHRLLSVAQDGRERLALERWLQGERKTDVLLAALGLAACPEVDGPREVKRFKDRVRKRIVRRFGVELRGAARNTEV